MHRAGWGRSGGNPIVAEVADVQPHLLPLAGGEHRGAMAPNGQLQSAHMTHAPVEHTRIGMAGGAYLTPSVQHGEGLAILEHEGG